MIGEASIAFLSIYLCQLLKRNKKFHKSSSGLEFAASSTAHELITPISASSFSGPPCAKRDFVYAGIWWTVLLTAYPCCCRGALGTFGRVEVFSDRATKDVSLLNSHPARYGTPTPVIGDPFPTTRYSVAGKGRIWKHNICTVVHFHLLCRAIYKFSFTDIIVKPNAIFSTCL